MFVDCRGFFLRHKETEKCIAASEELVYNNTAHAFPYFAIMTDNCLHDKAQFRYLESQLLHNIEKKGTLVSPPSSTYSSRWAVFKAVSTIARIYQNGAKHRLKQTAAGSLIFFNRNDRVCAEPSSKYILRKMSCNTKKQEFTLGE